MTIADELENREIEICPICNENPKRERLKTCSRECSIIRDKILKLEYNREYFRRPDIIIKQKIYAAEYCKRQYVKDKIKAYQQRPEVKVRKRIWELEYRRRPEVKERYKLYFKRPEVIEMRKSYCIKYNKKRRQMRNENKI